MPERKLIPRSLCGLIMVCSLLAVVQPVVGQGLEETRDDCQAMRTLYQGLPDSEEHQETRRHLAKALLAMPGCVRAEGQLQRARTLDGVSVFTPGRIAPAEAGEDR